MTFKEAIGHVVLVAIISLVLGAMIVGWLDIIARLVTWAGGVSVAMFVPIALGCAPFVHRFLKGGER